MRDVDVRQALHKSELAAHRQDPGTLILDEFGVLNGRVRIDVAVINGKLIGYEIKSERDTLQRLGEQATAYSEVFDEVVLVAAKCHLEKAVEIVPEWWGLTEAVMDGPSVILSPRRTSRTNPCPSPPAVAALLWRDEALAMLEEKHVDAGYRSKPRAAIYAKLASAVPLDELRARVRETLKGRHNWRAG